MQYAFHFNVDRCAECFACEVACKSAHDLAPHVQERPGAKGPRYRQVVELKDEHAAGCPIQYVSMACMHCGSADCMLRGSGDIELSGTLHSLSKSTTGTGDIDVSKLNVKRTRD